jgi:predicted enzyme related to lactoylglutathione lyase
MSRVVHFEIHATEPEVLIGFYSAVVGWTFTKAEGMEYWLIETGPADRPGINGGLLRRPMGGPADSPVINAFVCTVEVESVDAAVAAALEHGGEVALPRMAEGGVGWLAYVKDPDGNTVGLLEPDELAA